MTPRVPARPRRHHAREGGFVLPVALFVLVALSMISATGLYVARSDLRSAQATHHAAVALAAADAGAGLTLATWGTWVSALPAPGDSLVIDWQTLPDGSLYRSVVVRAQVGVGETPSPMVMMRTTGRMAPPGDARRTVVTLVEVSGGGGVCCTAAVKVSANIRITGPRRDDGIPDIDGTDRSPAGWPASQCTAPLQDLPGVTSADATGVELRRTGDVAGSPPIAEDPAITPLGFTDFGGITYADLTALADQDFAGNQRFRNEIGPVVSGGACVTGDARNWGSPLQPTGPCGSYFPVIHVGGSLRLQGSGQGQGILLVDGDLQIDDDFQFYGVIIVLGVMRLNGPSNLVGSVMVRGGANGQGRSDLDGGAQIDYSSCVTQKAMQSLPPSAAGGGGASAQERSWFEVIG